MAEGWQRYGRGGQRGGRGMTEGPVIVGTRHRVLRPQGGTSHARAIPVPCTCQARCHARASVMRQRGFADAGRPCSVRLYYEHRPAPPARLQKCLARRWSAGRSRGRRRRRPTARRAGSTAARAARAPYRGGREGGVGIVGGLGWDGGFWGGVQNPRVRPHPTRSPGARVGAGWERGAGPAFERPSRGIPFLKHGVRLEETTPEARGLPSEEGNAPSLSRGFFTVHEELRPGATARPADHSAGEVGGRGEQRGEEQNPG
eukprot:gene23469-biopygen5828